MDLYLKFESEQEAVPFLYNITPAITNEAGEVTQQTQLYPKFKNIDVIGVLTKMTGNFVKEDVGGVEMDVPEFKTIPGWHVNIRSTNEEDISEILQFAVYPSQPSRVWA